MTSSLGIKLMALLCLGAEYLSVSAAVGANTALAGLPTSAITNTPQIQPKNHPNNYAKNHVKPKVINPQTQVERQHPQGLRQVEASSCDIVAIRVGLGMVTQLVFETIPIQTLTATDTKFSISSNAEAPRSVAIISTISQEAIAEAMRENNISSSRQMIQQLDHTYATNLFVLFKGGNQLQFKLHLVGSTEGDSLVKIKQVFRKDCPL